MDEEDTVHAEFLEEFSFDRRPKQGVAFIVKPGRHNLPRDVVEAAIADGKAVEIAPKPRLRRNSKNTEQPAA